MNPDWELENEESSTLPRIEEILKELEVLKKVHLKALLARDEDGAGRRSAELDDSAIKQMTSYLRLVEKMVRILERRDRLRETSPASEAPLKVVLQVLKKIPEFNDALNKEDIQKEIFSLIRKDMAETEKGATGE
jgi:hypothetical protein